MTVAWSSGARWIISAYGVRMGARGIPNSWARVAEGVARFPDSLGNSICRWPVRDAGDFREAHEVRVFLSVKRGDDDIPQKRTASVTYAPAIPRPPPSHSATARGEVWLAAYRWCGLPPRMGISKNVTDRCLFLIAQRCGEGSATIPAHYVAFGIRRYRGNPVPPRPKPEALLTLTILP